MKISQVKTAFKVADIVLDNEHDKNHIKVSYLNQIVDEKGSGISSRILTSNTGRVYLIVVDGVIKKIGGSQSKGGIKATFSFYQSAMQGGPSIRSYGMHLLMKEAIENGSQVELYLIISKSTKAIVKGLFSEEKIETNPFKEMEDKCKRDYLSVEGNFPEWNYQERATPWPTRIHRSYMAFMQRRLKSR